MPWYHKDFFVAPPTGGLGKRPDCILTTRPGKLPRQSYPPQTGVFKLPIDDPLTMWLDQVAEAERWDEWDYCWTRLKYLPRWDLERIWQAPPGWITPHAFLSWAAWHITCAHGWINRLYRQIHKSHSPEQLLSSEQVVNPLYQYVSKNQIEFARRRTQYALSALHTGPSSYLPTPEVVTYPPDGLYKMIELVAVTQDLELSVEEFSWHESRARHKAEHFVHEVLTDLSATAVLLKRHLGDAGWSE